MINKQEFHPSISEKNGIDLIGEKDLNILSIGISTVGSAEIEMAKRNNESHIIATTLDKDGLEFTKEIITQYGLENRIELKIEDVSEKMPYSDDYFDFVYARLVLHYLDNKKLEKALSEIHRVLKRQGKIFIVVRSIDEWEAKAEGSSFDEETGLTKYPDIKTIGTENVKYLYRRLHSKESLRKFLEEAGFKIDYIKEYEEYLYVDYKRTEILPKPNKLIETCARKL